MQIAMATRDRRFDVTTAPTDVSKRVMDAVWCDHTRKSRYSTANAMLCTLERSPYAQSNSASTFKRPSVQGQAQLPSDDEEAFRQVLKED